MRRKSERVVNKKSKASPEKSIENPKRTKTRRRKQSSASDNESCEEKSPVCESGVIIDPEKDLQETSNIKDSLEESQDQVWQVKTAGSSGDVGEIQKLKLCLKRPSSTPERGDKSPRSKGKHSRATSSSDTPSVESVEDKRKKRRSRKASHESKTDKSDDSQTEQQNEIETVKPESSVQENNEVTQSETEQSSEAPVSTTNEEDAPDESGHSEANENEEKDVANVECKSDADTTVVSPVVETTVVSSNEEVILPNTEEPKDESVMIEKNSPTRKRSASVDKSEILELHPDDTKIESSDNETSKQQEEESKQESVGSTDQQTEVSINQEQNINKQTEVENNEQINKSTNESGVLENKNVHKEIRQITDSENEHKIEHNEVQKEPSEKETHQIKETEHPHSTQLTQEHIVQNGQTAPTAVNRKRRWGSRPTKLTTQKSITISTDVLKDIIPDVKPVEFEEVIEEKKHRRVEVPEKVERPLLPKIVIDNTENVEYKKKEHEKEVKEKEIKMKESLASNRKISIIKENDSIISRPPSPPKNKQSCILYITNLVRPFTSIQLKNLLLRTGRIVDNGFWMDKIKSKCFVQYENEDQAVETRHALHGVKWPVSNPKTLQVDFSTQEAFDKAKLNVEADNAQVSALSGTVEDWLRELDSKKERADMDKAWERKAAMREWDVGKNEKDKEKDKLRHDERTLEKRRHRSIERSPEPAKKFKKKEEEAPAKLLDDLFRKTKTTPCIYWLPLSAETIAVKEEQRRLHMAEYERRMQEQRRTHRRH